MKRFGFLVIFLSVIAVGLSGCSRPPCEKYLKYPPYIPPQKLIYLKNPMNVIQRREYDLCVLKTHGVQVIRFGQTWKFIFPSDDVFDNETAEINENYKPMLNVTADFMQTYSKISVEVAAYTNKSDDDVKTKFGSVSDELTERQAESVSNYLFSRHINSRLLYSLGKGAHGAVAWNGTPDSRYFNRRVEVTFRYYRDNAAWY